MGGGLDGWAGGLLPAFTLGSVDLGRCGGIGPLDRPLDEEFAPRCLVSGGERLAIV